MPLRMSEEEYRRLMHRRAGPRYGEEFARWTVRGAGWRLGRDLVRGIFQALFGGRGW